MAVVASDRLTLATLPSPSYVRTYYLKQSSTLNPPGVPKTNPPGEVWSTTEPTFSPNETATVYTVMLTAYGSVSFEYGPVQKSTSYEAAKQAYNQAVASGLSAQDALDKAQKAQDDLAYKADTSWVLSRGTDLVTNGTGYLGDNTNFSGFDFDSADGPVGTRGAFVAKSGANSSVFTDELIPVDPSKKYVISYFAIQRNPDGAGSRHYACLMPYDSTGRSISPTNYLYRPDTLTTLAQPLNDGDTYATLTDVPGDWSVGAFTYLGVWNYKDDHGKVWPAKTYTRTVPRYDSIQGNQVHFQSVYRGPSYPAGTPVSNNGAGGSYMYPVSNVIVPTEWTAFVGATVTGVHSHPTAAASTSFPPGTAAVKIGFLFNRSGPPSQHAFAGISFSDATAAQKEAEDAKTKAEEALADLATRPTKEYVDTQVSTSANGKNKITTSLNAPSGTGINGDLWRRHDSSGHVYQEFTWRDGGWKPTMVTSEMVTNMDIHKLTVSGDATFATLVADEIWSKVVRARLVVATELIAGDAIVKDSLSADRLKAKTITAESGVIDDLAIKEAHIGNASVTNAKIKDISAEKITSGYIDSARIDARTISTEKLLLGSFDNFFHDPRFEDERGYSPGVVVGETLRINAGQTVNVSWLAMPVDKDESYTVRFRKTGTGDLTFAIHSATTPSGPYSLVGDSFNTYTEEGDFGFTVTADKPYIRWVASNTTAQSFISDIKIQKVFTGIRLEDGIITTEKIQSGAVVSDSISADSITSEHMGANSVTAQSIGANQITGTHIGAGSITGEHIEAGSITAGNIGAESITTDKLHAGAVTYEKIELGAVRGDHLRDITKEQFMGAIDGDLSNIIDSAEKIADSVVISPGEIRLTTETTTNNDGVARNYLSLPASFSEGTLYDSHYSFSASQNSTITVSITLRADKPNSRFSFDLTRRGESLNVISNALVPTEWTTITGTAVAPYTDNYYIDLFMFNVSTGTQRDAAIDIAEVRIQGTVPNGNFENGDLHWNLPTGAEIKSLGVTTNETALSLTSTRQTFVVDGKDVVYIDSEEESMNIKNVVVDDSIRVGNHIIEKISDDITAFMWAGDRQ